MSKVDAQRALRDARYARFAAARAAEAVPAKSPAAKPAAAKPGATNPAAAKTGAKGAGKRSAEPTSEELFSEVPAAPTTAEAKSATPGTQPFSVTEPGPAAAGTVETGASPSAQTDDVVASAGPGSATEPVSSSRPDSSTEPDSAGVLSAGPDSGAPDAGEVDGEQAASGLTGSASISDGSGQGSEQAAGADSEVEEQLCGFRSMNGRSCTRTKGHEQKNHRYN